MKLSDKIIYGLLYAWMYVHALLPLRALYILSDLLYFFVYKIVRYRLKVVRQGLANSFPDKSGEELRQIERKFYHHFCDYFVETVKLLHISDEEMKERMKFENLELLNNLLEDGNSVLFYLGHYCNWEWVTSITTHFEDKPLKLGQIYKPLKNKAVDKLFLKIRGRFGSFGIPKNDTLRAIIKLRREGIQTVIGFMSDQLPHYTSIHYWTTFLNQETGFFSGVERIAKQTGYYVVYLDMEKVKRGYYKGTIRLITKDAKSEPEFAITERYARAMETTILRDPAFWLWTHKRWKRTRQQAEAQQEARHQK